MHFNQAEEVSLHFDLGDTERPFSPTARVVWTEPTPHGHERVGMRFLEIDAMTVGRLEHYVSDHFPRSWSVPA
jgi:hypothetical protein